MLGRWDNRDESAVRKALVSRELSHLQTLTLTHSLEGPRNTSSSKVTQGHPLRSEFQSSHFRYKINPIQCNMWTYEGFEIHSCDDKSKFDSRRLESQHFIDYITNRFSNVDIRCPESISISAAVDGLISLWQQYLQSLRHSSGAVRSECPSALSIHSVDHLRDKRSLDSGLVLIVGIVLFWQTRRRR
jgi:hypothetical protein